MYVFKAEHDTLLRAEILFTSHKLFVECPREGKVKANVPIP